MTKSAGHLHRILLVEDNPVNILLARSILEKGNHHVDVAQNGAQGIEFFQKAIVSDMPYHVIYMDLHMPVMDGMTAIKKIREIERQHKLAKTRIVALSADEREATHEAAQMMGADEFLSKPFEPKTLIENANQQG